MGKLRTLDKLHDLTGKTVVIRIDSDVDLDKDLPSGRQVVDDTRLAASLDTLEAIRQKGGKTNLIGHLGRPKGEDKEYTLEPIAKWFEHKLHGRVEPITVGKFSGWKITDHVNLLENIRFYPDEENPDTASGKKFIKDLAGLGDVYVNDAFAVSHRGHASIVGIAQILPSYAGFHMEREIKELSRILEDPKRPLVVLIGGAKIETKLPMVEKMHKVADYVLVGGEIAEQTKVLIQVQHEKVKGTKSAVLVSEEIESGEDITPKSAINFGQILGLAATIVWNGPVGKIGNPATERGTRELAHYIVRTNAYKVVGGGDTLAYLRQINMLDKFDFVSTGGGAMLEFLSGHKLPGIKVLED